MEEKLQELSKQWEKAKAKEKAANTERVNIEAEMAMMLNIPEDLDGTKKFETEDYKVTITGRITKKIDADLLQEIADENNTSNYLGTLFNWKPTLDAKAWRNANPTITSPLMGAITSKPGKPSFKVEKI